MGGSSCSCNVRGGPIRLLRQYDHGHWPDQIQSISMVTIRCSLGSVVQWCLHQTICCCCLLPRFSTLMIDCGSAFRCGYVSYAADLISTLVGIHQDVLIWQG